MDYDLNLMLVRVTGVAYVLPRRGKCVAINEGWLISRAGFVVPPHLSYIQFDRQPLTSTRKAKAAESTAGRAPSPVHSAPEHR